MKIFIIHGWTYNLDKWTPICKDLKSAGLEPVQLKVPGLTVPSSKSWTIDDYVEWLHHQLKKEKRPSIIAHSNGGRIVLSYLNKYPNSLAKLILIDSAGIPNLKAKSQAKLGILKTLAKLGKPLAAIPGLRKAFYKLVGGRDYLDAPPNMRQTMRNMLDADQLIDLSIVNLPVTIIWGKDDTQTPLADGQIMHQEIKNSKLHVINGARHAPFFTHPREVANIIKKALSA